MKARLSWFLKEKVKLNIKGGVVICGIPALYAKKSPIRRCIRDFNIYFLKSSVESSADLLLFILLDGFLRHIVLLLFTFAILHAVLSGLY